MNQSPERQPVQGLPMRYLLVFWLLVMSTIAFLDRTNISIAGVQIAKEFKIDNSRLGWVFSAFLVGYAGFQIPGGVILRRFGPRRVLSFCVILWGVFTVLTAMVPPAAPGALMMIILDVSLKQSIYRTLVPAARTRQGERHRVWGRRPGVGTCAAGTDGDHSGIRLACGVLVLRGSWSACSRGVVHGGAR
jgi:hypothetical protein